MANSASARKRIRSTARKHEDNRRVRSSVRTVVAKARRAIEGGSEESGSEELLRAAVSALDRAAERGVIHRRNAARRKSRLMARRPESQAVAAGPTAKAKPAARGTHRRPAAKK
ncbi:MAG: 30S ribosomal protein S20, partial [Candidatus Dormibacteria bacterium]